MINQLEISVNMNKELSDIENQILTLKEKESLSNDEKVELETLEEKKAEILNKQDNKMESGDDLDEFIEQQWKKKLSSLNPPNIKIDNLKVKEIKLYFHVYLMKITQSESEIKKNKYFCEECFKENKEKLKNCCGEEMIKLSQKYIEECALIFNSFLLFHTFIFYKNNHFLSFFINDRYKSRSLESCVKRDGEGRIANRIPNFKDFYLDYIIQADGKKLWISNQMVNFMSDYILHKLLNIPVSYDKEKIKLDDKLKAFKKEGNSYEVSKVEKIKAGIEEDIKKRKEAAKGFYSLTLLTQDDGTKKKVKDIELFVTLLHGSMKQFMEDLPIGNKVLDRVSKNILNVMSPGIASGLNKDVMKLIENAKKEYAVKFTYVTLPNGDSYCVVNNLDHDSQYSQREIEIIFQEVGETLPPREFKDSADWRPYTTERLVRLIKGFGEKINGRVYVRDVLTFLRDVLKASNDINWEDDTNTRPLPKDEDGVEYNIVENTADTPGSHARTTGNSTTTDDLFYRNTEAIVNDLIMNLQEDEKITDKKLFEYSDDLSKYYDRNNKRGNLNNIESFAEYEKLIHEIKEELLSKNEVITTKLISVIEKLSKEKLYEQDTGDYSVESHIFDYGGALRLSLLVFLGLVNRFKELEE